MKAIHAFIHSHKLSVVTLALHKVEGLTGMSVNDVRGFGHGKDNTAPHTVVDDLIDFNPYVKIEIYCQDEIVNEIVSAIQNTAHTGLKGDGKIYVTGVKEAYRISTGERGEKAV